MARFETHTVGSQILVLPKDIQFSPTPTGGNYIDELVLAKLNKVRITPSELCTDEQFLRRATIDIAGMLPTEAEYQTFIATPTRRKERSWLIDFWNEKSSQKSGR